MLGVQVGLVVGAVHAEPDGTVGQLQDREKWVATARQGLPAGDRRLTWLATRDELQLRAFAE